MPEPNNTATNTNQLRELLAIGDAAKYLGVSIDTLRRWEARGRIVPLRSPGGHRYFEKKDLDQLFGVKYSRDPSSLAKKEKVFDKPTKDQVQDQAVEPEIQIPEIKPIRVTNLNVEPPPPPPPVIDGMQEEVLTNKKVEKEKIEKPDYENKDVEKKDTAQVSQQTSEEAAVKPQAESAAELSLTQKEKLDDILFSDKKPERKIDITKLTIVAVIAFAILDIVLFLIWRNQPSIISPVP